MCFLLSDFYQTIMLVYYYTVFLLIIIIIVSTVLSLFFYYWYFHYVALPRATFFVLATSCYVCTDEGKYCPAEVGLLQFSLERGIIKEHNVIIKGINTTILSIP